MERGGHELGLVTLCIGGGQGIALLLAAVRVGALGIPNAPMNATATPTPLLARLRTERDPSPPLTWALAALVAAGVGCRSSTCSCAGGAGGDVWSSLLDERIPTLLVSTLGLAVVVCVAAGALGTALAYAVVRSDLPFRRAVAVLCALPLAIRPMSARSSMRTSWARVACSRAGWSRSASIASRRSSASPAPRS